jgi:hypothetical protein
LSTKNDIQIEDFSEIIRRQNIASDFRHCSISLVISCLIHKIILKSYISRFCAQCYVYIWMLTTLHTILEKVPATFVDKQQLLFSKITHQIAPYNSQGLSRQVSQTHSHQSKTHYQCSYHQTPRYTNHNFA